MQPSTVSLADSATYCCIELAYRHARRPSCVAFLAVDNAERHSAKPARPAMEKLDDVVLEHILSYLPVSALAAAQAVCTHW